MAPRGTTVSLDAPADCLRCDGTGKVETSSCAHGACPCAHTVTRPCPDCGGDRQRRCDEQDGRIARVIDDGDALCSECYAARVDSELRELWRRHGIDGTYADGTTR